MGEVSRLSPGDFTRFRERSPVPRTNSAGRTCGGAARILAAGSSSWGPGTGLCQASRRDSCRAGAWSYRTFPPPCHSLAVALMSRKGRTTLYCGAQSVRSSRWNLCARCSRDDMPGGGRSAVLSAKELGLASMAARKARGAPRRLSACLPPDASALACSCHVNPARPRSVGCSGTNWLSRARTCRKSGSSRREMVPPPTSQEQAAGLCGPGLILQVR